MRFTKAAYAAVAVSGLLTMLVIVQVRAADEWLPVKDVDLNITPGSGLDFSDLPGIQILDANKRLPIKYGQWWTPDGSEPARLHCASLALSPIAGAYPKAGAAAENYAHQLKMHGYNIVRFHYVDATLMTKRLQDFDYDPVQKDNWYSLLHLRKRGSTGSWMS